MQMKYTTGLMWFRRDLRAEDNAALHHALKSCQRVFCVFVFDRDILNALPGADRRVEFIRESLVDLSEQLRRLALGNGTADAGLLVRHDKAGDAIPALAARLSVDAVFTNHDDEPQALARDASVQALLEAQGVAFHSFKEHVIFERSEVADPGRQALQAWCDGQTGYPLVDAAMAQINQTGYMHNRLRRVTASFLVKDLGIDWRWGERYFAEKLNDFDLSANNGGWQWAASTGCDAQPYFRIFNPVSQSEKFDAEGKFIRKYLPVLEKLPTSALHSPGLPTQSSWRPQASRWVTTTRCLSSSTMKRVR